MEDLVNMPKTQRGKETLTKILNSAIQIFYEKGYNNASINDITNQAGVASGTFYIYFDGKYALYRFILLQCSHEIRKNMSMATKGCKNRREAERAGIRAWLEFTHSNKYTYNIIWESLYIDPQLFKDYYTNFADAYVRGLSKGQERGEIRADINSEVIAYTLMGMANFIGLNWSVFKESPEELDMVIDSIMKILDGGVFINKEESEEIKSEKPKEKVNPFSIDFNLDLS